MNWSNVTIGLTTSIIAHFILPNVTVIPKLDEYSVVDYRWSIIGVLCFYNYTFKCYHTLLKTIIICQTQPFTACSLTQHSSVFCKGHIIPADPLISEEDQEKKKCCPFSKCPIEKNKKALQYHSICIHRGCQWTYDGLKPYPSRASSNAWGVTTWRPFFRQRNVAKLLFLHP